MPEISEEAPEAQIQRDATDQTPAESPQQPTAPPPDLDKMARDILPIIKRMLAIERERQTRRW
jgi:hypothetical protein